jgi:Zn-dependent protease/predicted transcriptional regulator
LIYSLGLLNGIRVNLHLTLFGLFAFIIMVNAMKGNDITGIFLAFCFMGAVLFCIIIHEMVHKIISRKFNYTTKEISLFPLEGIAGIEKIPQKPRNEIFICLAGPLTNLLIAGILFILLMSSGGITKTNFIEYNPRILIMNLLSVNLFLSIFNLLPVFPLEGGRLLRALLSISVGRVDAARQASHIGQLMGIIFIVYGFMINPILLLIGAFVFLGATVSAGQPEVNKLLNSFRVGDAMMHDYIIFKNEDTLGKVAKVLLDGQEEQFLVARNKNISGIITSREILQGLAEFGENIPVSRVMIKDFLFLDPGMLLDEAYNLMLTKDVTIFPVIAEEKLLGILTIENVIEFVMVINATTDFQSPYQDQITPIKGPL